MPAICMPPVEELWRMCKRERPMAVAQKYGMTRQNLTALFDQHGLTGRGNGDPDQAEIVRLREQIKAGWSESQRADRWLGGKVRSVR